MTEVKDRRERAIDTPESSGRLGRSTTFRVLGILIVVIAAIGLFFLAIRDSDDESPTQAEGAVVTTTVVDEVQSPVEVTFPLGRFENTDSGLRTMELTETGSYIFRTDTGRVSGRFEVEGDLFKMDSAFDPGTYRWTFDDEVLKFQVVEDANRNRYAFITYPWVLSEN